MSGYSEKDKVIADLLSSRESLTHNDVTIKTTVDHQELTSSKIILSARSKYFEAMFSAHFKESSGDVEFPCTKPVMEKVLHFLYSGDIKHDNLSGIELLEYLDILRLLMMEEPFKYLEGVVKNQIDKGEFVRVGLVPILERAVDLQLEDTAQSIFVYIARNAKEELKTMGMETFMHQILTKIGSPLDSIERIKFYLDWVEAHPDKLSQDQRNEIRDSFSLLDFKFKVLVGDVYKSGLFEAEEIFSLLDSKYHLLKSQLSSKKKENKELGDKLTKTCWRCKRKLEIA